MKYNIHVHKNRLDGNLKLFLLIIPAIIFALTLVYLFQKYDKASNLAGNQTETNVLGESVNNLTEDETVK